MRFLYNELIYSILVGLLVGVALYFSSDKIIALVRKKGASQREEILKLMHNMFMPATEMQVTLIVYLSSFGLGFIFFLLFWPDLLTGAIVGAAIGFVGWNIPKLILKNMFEKRCSTFTNQMVDGLTIMANGIGSGLVPTQAMERVTQNMPNPIKQELTLVRSQINLGKTQEEAFIELAERIPRPDVQMFVLAVNILSETGGNMAETFKTIVYTIRERQKLEKKIQALTAQGRMQGQIISIMPFAVVGMLAMIEPSYIQPLYTTGFGLVLVGISIALVVIGWLVIMKIVNIKV